MKKNGRKVLVIDIGGTNVKLLVSGEEEPRKFPSGPGLTPGEMVKGVRANTTDWHYDVISMGIPAPVVRGVMLHEPVNLGKGWVGYDFKKAFGKPIKIMNDAAMQALGSYEGDTMLFLGLGTGLGTALVADGTVVPMELGHVPYKKDRTFEDYVGTAGLERLGKEKWMEEVFDVVALLKAALVADYVVLGGGNSKKLKEDLPEGVRRGDNKNAFLGGFRLWQDG